MHRYTTLILQNDIQESDCIYQNFQKKRNVQKFAKKNLLNYYRYPQSNNQNGIIGINLSENSKKIRLSDNNFTCMQ